MKAELRREYNRIYAYTTKQMSERSWVGDRKGIGLIKVGQTSLEVESRIRAQLQGSPHLLDGGYTILIDSEALRVDGSYFTDTDVFKWLRVMGINRIPKTEWFEATLEEIQEAVTKTSLMLSPRQYSYKLKNTVESREGKYDKEDAQIEKKFIK